MKTIRLMRLTLDNFKRIPHIDIDFGGEDWTIYGRNAAGKTTIYDAFYWLLFDKDSHGSKDFDIEPRNASGEVINPETVTVVSAVLDCDGAEFTFEKRYYQKWQQQRGAAERTYAGNTAEYYVDGVPQKKSEYDATVKAVVHEDLFKMLTNLGAFTSLHWTEQRAILFGMCDIGDDLTLMQTDERFISLADDMGRRSFTDYRKYLESQRKTVVSAKNAIPPRVDENLRTINEYQNIDADKANAELAELTEEAARLRTEKAKIIDNVMIADLDAKLTGITGEIRLLNAENEAHRKSQMNIDGAAEKRRLESEKKLAASVLRSAQSDMNRAVAALQERETRLVDLRKEYEAVSGKEFDGSKECPACGRPYDDAQIKKAMEAFDAYKAEKLGEIAVQGMELSKEVDKARAAVTDCQNAYNNAKSELDKATADYEGYTVETPVISDMPDYAEKLAALKADEQSIKEEKEKYRADTEEVRNELDRKLYDTEVKLRGVNAVLSRVVLAEAAKERVETLRKEERQLADEINRIDKMLYLAAEFTRFKVGHVQDSINSRFRITKFKLFNVQKNGGLEECCEATHNGIGFNRSLNDGARVNVALDIITALSAYHGISVPLFIDNAERVTGMLEANTQTIKLIVSADDNELRCEKDGSFSEEEDKIISTAAGC